MPLLAICLLSPTGGLAGLSGCAGAQQGESGSPTATLRRIDVKAAGYDQLELAIVVLEEMMRDLALRIEKVTDNFEDPAQVYAFGVRTVLETATSDDRWKQLLNRSEVIADAMFRRMGPFAIRDLRLATQAGRFQVTDAELVWRLATHAIVGVSLAVTSGGTPTSSFIGSALHSVTAGRPRASATLVPAGDV